MLKQNLKYFNHINAQPKPKGFDVSKFIVSVSFVVAMVVIAEHMYHRDGNQAVIAEKPKSKIIGGQKVEADTVGRYWQTYWSKRWGKD